MTTDDLRFGTSGLRGLAAVLDGPPAFAYASAFASMLVTRGEQRSGDAVLVGRDLRPSSPSIAIRVAAGLEHAGLNPLDCGELPTPALAAQAMSLGVPAVMVTGSHIPGDRNGLKFYRRDGEIDKQDEIAITARLERMPVGRQDLSALSAPDGRALQSYRERMSTILDGTPLAGMRVGVYQHSSVARDLLVDLLGEGGADVTPLGCSDGFVPVDTEALRAEDEVLAHEWSSAHGFDAIVSTDGDADRPLIADERGRFMRGDLVGTVTAHALGADCVVTPVSSNSGIELCARFDAVRRTRIGSPFVIAGMKTAQAEGARCIVGFEANGGVLLADDAVLAGRPVPALPTRDAMLPILAVLLSSRGLAAMPPIPLSGMSGWFGFAATASGRLAGIATQASAAFIARLRKDEDFRRALTGPLVGLTDVDLTDGVRLHGRDGTVLHFRASGNAPELRCYVEAADDAKAQALLAGGLAAARRALNPESVV